jgi:hypothetical protein
VVDQAFVSVLFASITGLVLSVAIERVMTPRPLLARAWAAWGLHCGLWLLAHALLTFVLGRPWFSAAAVSAVLLMLVLVNNAKVKTLREPFVFQDYEYFIDVIRHPRLYIPFLGWWKLIAAATGFVLAVGVGLWGEAAPAHRFSWAGQLGGTAAVFAGGAVLFLAAKWKSFVVSFEPERDTREHGLLASLWLYGEGESIALAAASPLDFLVPKLPDNGLPHLVAVQSESFFDPRLQYPFIRTDVLAEFDRLKNDSLAHGKLKVPAWGANTVRTEFAFLTGIGDDKLGVHRFNPYRVIAGGTTVPSLASYLERQGYRTICIHPYPASFYKRDLVYPRLGFNEFHDIRTFDNEMRFGPYIGDSAVADKVTKILSEATKPVFIFVITMENHGPLHLEHVTQADINDVYRTSPPDGCDDLTIYLRHLRNADRMIFKLRLALEQCRLPASLCWFGDHVPIMPDVYKDMGAPSGEVDYVIWSNQGRLEASQNNLAANDLSIYWLWSVGFVNQFSPSFQGADDARTI